MATLSSPPAPAATGISASSLPAQSQHSPTKPAMPSTRQLNAASIFQRLGLADHPPVSPVEQHLAARENNVTTPTPENAREGGKSYMDSGSISSVLARTSLGGDDSGHTRSDSNGASNSDNGTAVPQSRSDSSSAPLRSIKPIDADIILPFADRPEEIKELLEVEPKNLGLYEQLKETFSPSLSSSTSNNGRWSFSDLVTHLRTPREEMADQDFIDLLKASVQPRSQLLWERLRACLGVDVDDERGMDRFEELSSDIMHYEDPDAPSAAAAEIQPRSLQDYLLSPRAVLQQQNSQNQTGGSVNNGLQLPNIGAVAPPPGSSPGGFSGMSVSPLSGSSFLGHSPNSQPGGLPTATLEHPNPLSPRQVLSALPSAPNASANACGGGGGVGGTPSATAVSSSPSPRNHRRTSSGSSGFRRSMQMSSINEDSPVTDFNDDHHHHHRPSRPSSSDGGGGGAFGWGRRASSSEDDSTGTGSYDSSPMMSPSSSYQGGLNNLSSPSTAAGARVGLGDLLRLKGHPLDGSPTTSATIQAAGGHPSSGSVGHALGLGNTGTGNMQGSALASSFGSTLSSSVTPAFNPLAASQIPGHLPPVSPDIASYAGTASSLGLSLGGTSASAGGGITASYSATSPARSRTFSNLPRTPSSAGNDGFTNVFESEDGESIRSFSRGRPGGVGSGTGPGPGVRILFSARPALFEEADRTTVMFVFTDETFILLTGRRGNEA